MSPYRWFVPLLLACQPHASLKLGAACKSTTECVSGLFCRAGTCSNAPCKSDADCGAGGLCNAQFQCAVGDVTAQVPSIADVRGLAANGRVGADRRIAISGDNLEGGSVTLVNSALELVAGLEVVESSAQAITAALPAMSLPNALVLRVVTTGGSVTRDVSVLQGEPGAAGAAGPPGDPTSPAAVATLQNQFDTVYVKKGPRILYLGASDFFRFADGTKPAWAAANPLRLVRNNATQADTVWSRLPLPHGATVTDVWCQVTESNPSVNTVQMTFTLQRMRSDGLNTNGAMVYPQLLDNCGAASSTVCPDVGTSNTSCKIPLALGACDGAVSADATAFRDYLIQIAMPTVATAGAEEIRFNGCFVTYSI